ncbi:hypothetical protein M8818_006349 [Zalaria obscura]|uniref:Uncharacterized protein n=1 Tax=Zalaria obscura TaxID=2024903 RepID=A0ACC3S5Q2_9PEZI
MAPRSLNPCSYLPRRLQIVVSLAIFTIVCIALFGSASPYEIPYQEEISDKAAEYLPKQISNLKTPGWINPFRAPAHAPPVQANSSSGEASWFSDWKWQNPFSSSITLDENRSVLPPLKKRVPIYTYYDGGKNKDQVAMKAEHDLLVIWRRAWWAQGLKPVVLGKPEAINNPLYRTLQNLEVDPEMEIDLMRWLAWGNMGTGILANWLALPMAPYGDPTLTYLRRGEYPELTRYEGLSSGIFAGEKDAINKAIKAALEGKEIAEKKALIEVVPEKIFNVDPQHDAIAFYSTSAIKKYKNIAEKLFNEETRSDGLSMLPELINSHLHTTWQNQFSSGIAVLKPLPEHTSQMVFPAIELARNLSQCSDSPSPSSCPPNREKCSPCVASHPMLITTPTIFRNTSTLFTVGTIPHPYTLASLQHQTDTLNTRFIRRQTKRDEWILAATKELLGTGLSSFSRLTHVKDAIASDYGQSHSLWLTPEKYDSKTLQEDLAWIFGFVIPNDTPDDGRSETPVPGPERRPPPPKPEGKVPDQRALMREKTLLDKSRIALKNSVKPTAIVRDVVEAWNLADTEVWRFARAYNARRRVERLKWDEEEKKFAGGEKGSWGRWWD